MGSHGQLIGDRPGSIYEDDLPDLDEGASHDYQVADHHFRVSGTLEQGCDTGRRRYRVECLTCREVVHEATTGARWNMETHVRRAARGEGTGGPSNRTLAWHHLTEALRHLRAVAGIVADLEEAVGEQALTKLVSAATDAATDARDALAREVDRAR